MRHLRFRQYRLILAGGGDDDELQDLYFQKIQLKLVSSFLSFFFFLMFLVEMVPSVVMLCRTRASVRDTDQ